MRRCDGRADFKSREHEITQPVRSAGTGWVTKGFLTCRLADASDQLPVTLKLLPVLSQPHRVVG